MSNGVKLVAPFFDMNLATNIAVRNDQENIRATEKTQVFQKDESLQPDTDNNSHLQQTSEKEITEESLQLTQDDQKSKQQYRSKKGVAIKRFQISFDGEKRQDIQIKCILRLIRKTLIKNFNTLTKYDRQKRRKEPSYLILKLEEYFNTIFGLDFQNQNQVGVVQDSLKFQAKIKFFLGSIFYSQIMKECYQSKKERDLIDFFSNILKRYSNKVLDKMLLYKEFRYVISYFITNNKDEVLEKFNTQPIEQENLRKGFEFLGRLAKLYETK